MFKGLWGKLSGAFGRSHDPENTAITLQGSNIVKIFQPIIQLGLVSADAQSPIHTGISNAIKWIDEANVGDTQAIKAALTELKEAIPVPLQPDQEVELPKKALITIAKNGYQLDQCVSHYGNEISAKTYTAVEIDEESDNFIFETIPLSDISEEQRRQIGLRTLHQNFFKLTKEHFPDWEQQGYFNYPSSTPPLGSPEL